MLKINFPSYNFKLKKKDNKEIIFDEVRRRWVTLTPEEWVRQHFLQYLIQDKKYPAALIAVEKKLMTNGTARRCDIIVYKNEKPWLLIECKEPSVLLDDKTLWQVLNYNMSLGAPYITVTNGSITFCFYIENGQVYEMTDLPGYR